jgi:hypothetical protein
MYKYSTGTIYSVIHIFILSSHFNLQQKTLTNNFILKFMAG